MKRRNCLAKLRELGYDEVVKGYAGVVELADTLDSKSKIALLEKLLRELKRKIQ